MISPSDEKMNYRDEIKTDEKKLIAFLFQRFFCS